MLNYVKESKTATADQVERGIFKRLLELGFKLMLLFFTLRAEAYPRTPVETETGEKLPYFDDKKRAYYSIFGKLPFVRPYFYAQGVAGQSPLDAELSLGSDCYSDLVREIAEYLGADVTYEKVTGIFARILGQKLSTNAVSKMVAEDAADVEAYYEQKPAPKPEDEGQILVIQADGKGVPMVRETCVQAKVRLGKGDKRTKKKEAIVTGIYTIQPNPRTPEEVVASFFHKDETPVPKERLSKRSKPQNKQLWATLQGKDVALERLARQVNKREGPHIKHRIALTDGAQALQARVLAYCSGFTLILDFIHADEYLWDVANRLFDEKDPLRIDWVEARTLKILSGETQQVITEFRTLAPQATPAQRQELDKAANYFERNLPYMAYDHYLAQGWPIASGVIEGACRHLVKDRFELSGMRWTQTGAENLLRLRAVSENGDWDDYHQFRKQRRHLRLYASPLPTQDGLEDQALDVLPQTSDKIVHFDSATKQRLNRPNLNQQQAA
jgi:transglutaminase-like putative cysteine protease